MGEKIKFIVGLVHTNIADEATKIVQWFIEQNTYVDHSTYLFS